MRSRIWICAAAAVGIANVASAAPSQISVSNAWFRALPQGLPAGGYFTLNNGRPTPIELVAAKSAACGMLMLHQSMQSGGMSRMMDVPSVTVPAGGMVRFAPGGYHMMCVNPRASMTPGSHVDVILIFADRTEMHVDFAVKNASGQ
jgi:periplasmic copper chaperone A